MRKSLQLLNIEVYTKNLQKTIKRTIFSLSKFINAFNFHPCVKIIFWILKKLSRYKKLHVNNVASKHEATLQFIKYQ